MFEKEADYRKARKESKDRITKVIKVWSAEEETIHDEGFQKGAEFGYNKANEWHYVKDGDLPNEDIYLVIRLNDENTCYKYCTGFWEKEEKCFHTLFCSKVNIKDIIAWKEIVLPKELAE